MHRIRHNFKTVLLASLLLLGGTAAFAFTFMPMSISISPSGAQSIATFRLTNDGGQQIAIAIKATTRQIDESGTEINGPADQDFTIFPTRIVVQPNSFQIVKVQYKGTPKLSKEMPYRIIAEQVPIDFTQQQTSGVKVMFRYIAALYVTPPNVNYKLAISKVEYAEQEGTKGFLITVTNTGTRHALINDPVIKITAPGSAAITLQEDAVKSMQGQNLLPGNVRHFFLPYEKAVQGLAYLGILSATIE